MSSNYHPQPRRPPQITVNNGGDVMLGDLLSDSSHSHSTPGTSRRLLPPQGGLGTGESSRSGQQRHDMYGAPSFTDSSDMLLPPATARGPRPYQDAPSHDYSSRPNSAMSSRRTSISSDGGRSRDSRHGPFASPFDDSRTPSRAGSSSEDEQINTQTVAERYNITPSASLLLYPEDVEKDDWLHNPDPSDKDREKFTIFNKRGFINMGGLALITIGVLVLFIGFPALTFVRQTIGASASTCSSDPNCLSDKLPLLVNQRVGLIDPDTPESVKWKTAKDGGQLQLVFSDEFNKPGRTFYPGDDPYFEAVDIWYGATQDLEWYDPDAVTTANGTLNLQFDAFQSHLLNYRSGMVQSWNKLCFKGGRLEASISLPGSGEIEGFWPGFWAMGNLGRPGYIATTDGMWPYSYWDKCDVGITKNQSDTTGINWLPGMKLPACTCSGQDHPSPGNSRGAPEIDAIEASVGYLGASWSQGVGSASQSFQTAPFDVWYQPDYNYIEVYDGGVTSINQYAGGNYQQALSGVTWLNNRWYSGSGYQTYGFEYNPGDKGDITWFVGNGPNSYTWKIDGRAIRPNGNIGQRMIPQEPMSIVMNFGMGFSFAQVMLANLAQLLPATMRFDYIRIYQDPNNQLVTCDPPGYPTTDYIRDHPKAYLNPNVTSWAGAGYKWPTNRFVDNCS